MSSNINTNTLTKEQLFACFEHDGITVEIDKINKAKSNDGPALQNIGYAYHMIKKDYSKAMTWYRLAANQNKSLAYNSIGYMYFHGLGVSRDYLTAMEYFLKAARGNENIAMSNIGLQFLNGKGLPADKYKALEWYIKSGDDPEEVKELNQEGIHLTEEDKKKTIYQLANEVDDVIREQRMKKESKLKEENEELKYMKTANEREMENLRKENQALRTKSQQNQQQIIALQHEKELLKQLNGSYDKQLKEKDVTIKYLRLTADTFQSLLQSKQHESTGYYF